MSQHQWGRSNDAGRQRLRWPVYTLAVFPLALAAGIGMAVYQYQVSFTTLQRWYLPSYLKSSYIPRLGARFAAVPSLGSYVSYGDYQLVDLVGDRYIARQPKRYAHADMEPWLRETIYDGQPAGALAWWPLATSAGVFVLGLCLAIPLDARRRRIIREGEVLRGGPRERTVPEFNRAHLTNNGIRIRVER